MSLLINDFIVQFLFGMISRCAPGVAPWARRHPKTSRIVGRRHPAHLAMKWSNTNAPTTPKLHATQVRKIDTCESKVNLHQIPVASKLGPAPAATLSGCVKQGREGDFLTVGELLTGLWEFVGEFSAPLTTGRLRSRGHVALPALPGKVRSPPVRGLGLFKVEWGGNSSRLGLHGI